MSNNNILASHFRKATAEFNPYVKFHMSDDMRVWYMLFTNVSGDSDEFTYGDASAKFGEYVIKMVAPDDFPYAPPSFYSLTPNGVYQVGGKICISIGEFHSQDYRATLGMDGFVANVISGFIGWKTIGSGIRLIETTVAEKRELAQESRAYNAEHNSAIVRAINESFQEYSAKWTSRTTRRPRTRGKFVRE